MSEVSIDQIEVEEGPTNAQAEADVAARLAGADVSIPTVQPTEAAPVVEVEKPAGAVEDAPKPLEIKPYSPGLSARVDTLTRNWREEERKNQELARQNQLLQAQLETLKPGAVAVTLPAAATALAPGTEAFNQAVAKEAARVAAENDFNNKCNAVVADGKKTYGDGFDVAIRNLSTVLGPLTTTQVGIDFLNATFETGKASNVLAHLGANPERAQEIAAMNPVKRGMELYKLAESLAAPTAQISKAPRPVTPIESTALAPAGLDDRLSDEEWMKQRAKQFG